MVFHVSLRYGACEPQICVRVAEEEETFVRENKSGSGLCSPRLLLSSNHVRLPASHRPLVRSRPSWAGAATNWRDFSVSAVQTRVVVFTSI